MELKPVRNARNCRTDIEEAERLRDTHATGEVFCQRRESAKSGPSHRSSIPGVRSGRALKSRR